MNNHIQSDSDDFFDHTSDESREEYIAENLTMDLEQSLPYTASSPLDAMTDGPLTMPAVCKKDNGSRKYNKKQYCL